MLTKIGDRRLISREAWATIGHGGGVWGVTTGDKGQSFVSRHANYLRDKY